MAASNPHHQGNPSLEWNVKDDQKRQEICAKDLSIVWGKDERYWNVPNDEKSPAELYQVCWLEVTGCFDKISSDKEYEVGFNLSLTPNSFGWSGAPVYILAKRGKGGKFRGRKLNLDNVVQKNQQDIAIKLAKLEDTREKVPDDSKVYFGLYEVWSGKWKGGLKIHHAYIRELP